MQDKKDKDKIMEIIKVLPKLNCGECGFENCGKFAIAVADGRALPFGCRQDPSVGYELSKIIGVQVPEVAAQPIYTGILDRGQSRAQVKGTGQGKHHRRGMGRGRCQQFGRGKRQG